MRWLLKAGFAAPNPRDRELLQLPRAIGFLYYLVRPLRLILDYFTAKRSSL